MTMKRSDNLYFKFKMSAVRADMTDSDLIELSDGNGRMLTSLRCRHAELNDPALANFAAAFDHWHSLMRQQRESIRHGSDAEFEFLSGQLDRAHERMTAALDAIEMRDERR
jgi:hypothetical protein